MGTTDSDDLGAAVAWYYAKNGQHQGPVGDVELRKLIETQVVTSDDLVWRPGFESWKKASEVQGLYTPPPLPKSNSSAIGAMQEPSAQEPCSLRGSIGDINFNCPQCQGSLVVDASAAGETVNCPRCDNPILIPTPQTESTAKPIPVEAELSAPPPTPRSRHGRYLRHRPIHVKAPTATGGEGQQN